MLFFDQFSVKSIFIKLKLLQFDFISQNSSSHHPIKFHIPFIVKQVCPAFIWIFLKKSIMHDSA